MAKVFNGESWYADESGSEEDYAGTLCKVGGDCPSLGRNHQYSLILPGGEQTPVYSGGDIQILDDFVGQEVRIRGKSICCGVNGDDKSEIWPGEIEVVSDGVIPGP